MSQELPSNKNTNEEIDLIVLFNLIGNAINNFFKFIGSFFKSIFSLIIHALKIFIDGWKVIIGVILLSAIIGYAVEITQIPLYKSQMLVKPYFDSKYQLVNNIGFFNSLISNNEHEELDKIFNSEYTPKIDVTDINEFVIEPGPETENDRIKEYQAFARGLDSFGREQVDYDKYLEDRSIYSGNIFLITAVSNKNNIFSDLTFGINTAFTNAYSSSKKMKDTLLYEIQRENIENSLKQVEKLQAIYLKVLQDQANNPGQPVKMGDLFLTKDQEVDTKEYALLDKELALRDQLRKLDEKRVTEDVFVDIISSFQPVGYHEVRLLKRFTFVFPALSFLLLCLFYLGKRTVIYVKNYED
ncbi:hypothetical protein [Lacinutrix jangbogonensis]|uniref:hypothetical protein n=1 Tax=Lacinutrix jangbogonensis TaxID=1469557 RepID=UPI00053D69C9|nr:hypothetical protein [Lacinutrix jangbogonensis]